MSRSPYRFLAAYGQSDSDLFVGREQEIETLLGDIISSRLVVLFARTGTGKTSLINAGVRPRLERLDYWTMHLRVESDPLLVVRRALEDAGLIAPRDTGESVPAQLRTASRRLERPIVVFFDQFEEFFIRFRDGERRLAEPVEDFIAQVAELYRDRESGIHTVFSMREEYFVEMDAFRDQIPSVFHNESTLRLRPFRRAQALRAVTEPAAVLDVGIDLGLPELIVADLEQDGFIEPPQLQIVCDTLWRAGGGRRLRMADYQRLGGAAQVFSRRLEQEVSRLPDAELALLEQLIPALRTDDGTKSTRGIDELADTTRADADVLRSLLESLKSAHLVNELVIGRGIYVEWVSDFLAERSEDLRGHARLTVHQRMLDEAATKAVDADAATAASADASASGLMGLILPLSRENFARISVDVARLAVDAHLARRGLVSALVHGLPARGWLERARSENVDVRGLLQALLGDADFPEAGGAAVRLLGELGEEPMAVALLEEALGAPRLRIAALDALAQLATDQAAAALRRAVDDDVAAGAAPVDALRRMGTRAAVDALVDLVLGDGAFQLRAASALNALATEPEALGRAALARESLAAVLDQQAPALLRAALQQGVQTRAWFDQARSHGGVDAWTVLRDVIDGSVVGSDDGEIAVSLLRELPDAEATELLQVARSLPHLKRSAEEALEARGELRSAGPPASPQPVAEGRAASSTQIDSEWDLLLQRIATGRCLPLLGQGLPESVVSLRAIARKWATGLDFPFEEDAANLARVAQFMTVQFDRMYVKESLVQEFAAAGRPDYEANDDPYTVLASLPLPLYLTTGFDDFLEAALRRAGRDPISDICRWHDDPSLALSSRSGHDVETSVGRPLVFHLHGRLEVPQSLVLSEDDHFDFLAATLTRTDIVPHPVKAAVAGHMRLALGFGTTDWSWSISLRGLMQWGSRELRRSGMIVLLPPIDLRQREFFGRRAEEGGDRVYWGTAPDFAKELSERWQANLAG